MTYHGLAEIKVNNFRSIKEEDFILSDYTALIGYNNAGKTNILVACKWLLRKWVLSESDFNNPSEPIEVVGTVSGITEEILGKLPANQSQATSPFLDEQKIVIKRIQESPGGRATDVKLFVRKFDEEAGEYVWNPAPTGLDNAMNDLFPEPILIGATENIEEDVTKNKTSTTIGRLISEIIAPIEEKYGGTAKDAMDVLRKALDADGEERAEELCGFDDSVNEKLQVLFPSVSVRLHVPTPELKEFFKAGTIKVYEDGHNGGKDISTFGSGAQRSIQMALIRQLAEVRRGIDPAPTRTLLLIDEPELYLHPQAIEQVRVALKQLSGEGFQVIFATHSAQMVRAEDVNKAILIRKDLNRGTYRRKRIEDAINTILAEEGYESQLEMMFALSHSHQILFAESVLLTEGITEHYLIPQVFEHLAEGETLGTIKCALVKQGGVNNTHKSMNILKAMDIPTKAIVDLDYAFGQASFCGLISEDNDDIQTCKRIFSDMKTEGLVVLENGLPTKNGILKTKEAYREMSGRSGAVEAIQRLHDELKGKGIWLWKKGVIETHLGIDGKKHRVWSKFIERLKNEGCETVIDDYNEVVKLVAWIKEI